MGRANRTNGRNAARADTITTSSASQAEPKCMDAANTQPAGCIPSVPLSQSSTTTTTTDAANSLAAGAIIDKGSSANSSTSSSNPLNVSPNVGVDANAGVSSSSLNAGATISPGVNGATDATKKDSTTPSQ